MYRVNIKQSRFSDAPWFQKDNNTMALVGGAGGIGSWLCLFLTRAGFIPYVWDFDTIEEHNLSGQFFPMRYIGELKVQALSAAIRDFTGISIKIAIAHINTDSPTHKYAFSAFDNMEARKIMFTKWRSRYEGNPDAIFIDGRLQAEQLQIFCIKGDDLESIERYESSQLFDDSEVEEASCTFKQTTHVAAMIASYMTAFFTNFIANKQEGNTARKIPYYHEYFIPMHYVGKNPE